MTPELTVLALAGLLQAAQLVLMAVAVNREVSPDLTTSPRDGIDLAAMVRPRTARLVRAFNNHNEALILFTLAVLVVTLSGQSTAFTQTCAWIYLAARIAYVPAYYAGLAPGRSAIFGVGFAATIAMILASLL
jgi:uncharacterized MAPEG superfamily protein